MATVDKFERVCRLCSEEKNEMLQIFGNEGVQRKVAHKLRACLPVMVYQTDPLPKQICQFCAARLDDVYEFRERCMNVYKKMYTMLLRYKQTESVKIFLDAMLNSSDPCQAQLCKKFRAPPPLVPLGTSLPVDNSVAPVNQINQDQGAFIETLSELPCEVEIKEMMVEPNSNTAISVYKSLNKKRKWLETYRTDAQTVANTFSMFDTGKEKEAFKIEQARKEEKRTSILEQVLTGNLTMNNLQRLQPKARLTSEWLCAPCNTYYKTKDALVNHFCLHCPRVYSCKRCHLSFQFVEALAKHEASSHLKVRLGSTEGLKDCDQCSRQFMSWVMLKQHRLRDHSTEPIENKADTWCSVCNRSFLTARSYKLHTQLHQAVDKSIQSQKSFLAESALPALKTTERPREVKRTEQFNENAKSLSCPTCGKVCTQQSALSNHMRTHEPKRYKCNFCGRSFGLYIRLAAHKMSEHIKQSAISPIMSAVEQEEALNAEREAREAREARTRVIRRSCPELHMTEKSYVASEDEPGGFKKIAKCGICSRWFSDHTTMLTHLQTHSDNFNCRSYVCHVCKMSFKEQRQLTRHEACHKLTSLYMCNTCNKSFTDKSLYKAHQRTHTVDKTYHCAKCNKIFFKEVSLLAHQCTGGTLLGKRVPTESTQKTSSHDNGKRYKYDASFLTSLSRNAHAKVQNDDVYDNTVQRHEIKVETDDDSMPKLSPEASLEYSAAAIEPRVEIDEHNVSRPLKRTLIKTSNGYRCGVCESPFVLRELAVAHLRSAHPVMSYQCCYSYCKKRFTTQYTFSHHMKTEHPDEPEK